MFTLIIIVLTVAFTVGVFKHLSAKEKAIVAERSINAIKYGSTVAFRSGRDTIRGAYNIGQEAGLELALNGQDTLDVWEKFNAEIKAHGGAVKAGVQTHENICSSIGLGSFNDDSKARIAAKKAELEARRAARQSN